MEMNLNQGRRSRSRESNLLKMPLRNAHVMLYAFTALCALLAMIRWYTGAFSYIFLLWNIFLAWIPLWVSTYIYRVHDHRRDRPIRFWAAGFVWLIFYPNAPYIATDVVHIDWIYDGNVSRWFDIILLLSCAWTGVLLGFVSLYTMRKWVVETYGRAAGNILALAVIALSSFGVFIGRFLRWNSWDVIVAPHRLLGDLKSIATEPYPFFFSLLFGVFLFMVYVVLFSLTENGVRSENGRESVR